MSPKIAAANTENVPTKSNNHGASENGINRIVDKTMMYAEIFDFPDFEGRR